MKNNKKWLSIVLVLTAIIVTSVCAVTPAIAADVSVTRDLPEAASPGEEFKVSLIQSGFHITGYVTETLPEGFKNRGVLSGGKLHEPNGYDETTNELTMDFDGGATTLIYKVEAGTAEQIENAFFSGTYKTWDEGFNPITGDVAGDTTLTLTLAEPTPTPTPTAGGGNGGGGGGGVVEPPSPPVGEPAYIHLNATPAEIPADAISTSTITAFVWDGEKWVLENLTVNFSTSSGNIAASAPIVNRSAIAILTAGTKEGIANVTAEANLSGDTGIITNTTTVNFTIPGITPTPTPEVTPMVTPSPTPTATPTASPTPSPAEGIPGFEAIFAIAGLLAIAYLVLRRRG